MNSTPIRKSLFFAEKKHGPGTGFGQNESFSNEQSYRMPVDPNSIVADPNNRSDPSSVQSFSPSQGLMANKTGDDPKSFTEHFTSLSEQNKSDSKIGHNLSRIPSLSHLV